MQWNHSGSPKPKKFKLQISAGKVMLMAFFDHEGLLAGFKKPGAKINTIHCNDTLDKLHTDIKNKQLASFVMV